MKCSECPEYINKICSKAQQGKLGEMELECLARCQVMLLRDIWTELAFRNERKDNDDWWRK